MVTEVGYEPTPRINIFKLKLTSPETEKEAHDMEQDSKIYKELMRASPNLDEQLERRITEIFKEQITRFNEWPRPISPEP